MILRSRSLSVPSTESSCSFNRTQTAASAGTSASGSAMKSPSGAPSSSPMGVSSDTGSFDARMMRSTVSREIPIHSAISAVDRCSCA